MYAIFQKFYLLVCLVFLVCSTHLLAQVKVGVSVALTGPSKNLGIDLVSGMKFALKDALGKNEIAYDDIKLIIKDDAYNPKKSIQNTLSFFKDDRVDVLFSYAGTPTVQAVLPLLMKYKKLLLFPFTGAQILKQDPFNQYVLMARPSYGAEIRAIVDYFLNDKRKKVGVYYQLDGYGVDGLMGVKNALSAYQLKPSIQLSYPRGKSIKDNYLKEAQLILDAKLDGLIVIASYQASAGLISELRKSDDALLIANLSFCERDSLTGLLKVANPNYVSQLLHSQVVDSGSKHAFVRRYLSYVNHFNAIEFEGYLNMKLLIEWVKTKQDFSSLQSLEAFVRQKQKEWLYPNIEKHPKHQPIYLYKVNKTKWESVKK